MNWSDVGKRVAQAAPMIGAALGGPAGGAVGALVASLFGTAADPAKVAEAIGQDPEAMVKLRQLELDHKTELTRMTLEAETSRIASVNKTMQAEAASDKWWVSGWRPFWGFTAAIAFFVQVGAIAYLLVSGGDARLIEALGSLSIFWSVPLAILGVSAWHRGMEKRVRCGEQRQQGGGGILGVLGPRASGG